MVKPTHLPEVCPWNVKFSEGLPVDSLIVLCEMCVDTDAPTLERRILAMDQAAYAAAFKDSAVMRAGAGAAA